MQLKFTAMIHWTAIATSPVRYSSKQTANTNIRES